MFRKLTKAETCYNTLNIWKKGLDAYWYFYYSNVQTYLVHT